MIENYFVKFPVIAYGNRQVRNISERITVLTTPKLAPLNYYPYELGEHVRADQLAQSYYSDPTLDWLIWVVNYHIDPYYDWHLYPEDFNNYITNKYGDLGTAQQTVAFFRTNWADDPSHISSVAFDNLDGSFKKYWEPVWGPRARIIGYRRKQEDIIMNTNKIVEYDITMNSTTNFQQGDLLHFYYNFEPQGYGECITANSTYLTVQHHINNTTIGTIQLRDNEQINATMNSFNPLVFNIVEAEGAFWEAVSYYDVEVEDNENKRFIDVLDVNQVMPLAEEVRTTLNPTRQPTTIIR